MQSAAGDAPKSCILHPGHVLRWQRKAPETAQVDIMELWDNNDSGKLGMVVVSVNRPITVDFCYVLWVTEIGRGAAHLLKKLGNNSPQCSALMQGRRY